MNEDYRLIVDLWRFWKVHADPHQWNDDKYWQKLLNEANAFYHAHGSNEICQDLIAAVMKELQRRGKK